MFSERTNWDLSTNRLSSLLAERRNSKRRLFDLSASNPTECGFHYDQKSILKAFSQRQSLRYSPDPKGPFAGRKAIVQYYRNFGRDPGPEDIFLTTGTSEAYSFVFRLLCNPGDEILVPQPSYPLLDLLADIQDVKLIRYPLVYDHGWQIDFQALLSAITPRSRAVVVINPNNPTGNFVKAEEAKQLSDICSKGDMAILADEVFLDFGLLEERPVSFAGNKTALTFTMNGLSKIAGLPQMKASWLLASGPEELKSRAISRLEVIADTYLSMNTPTQLAIPTRLKQRLGFQKQAMTRIRANLAELDRQLLKRKTCSRLKVEAGWNAVLQVPKIEPDEDLAIRILRDKSVYLHPGHFYDFPSEGFLILSLITPKREFAEGIRRVLSCF